jgi:hypothetical protein
MQFRYTKSLYDVPSIKRCTKLANKPRAPPINIEAKGIINIQVCGVNVMGMKKNEGTNKIKRNTKSLNINNFIIPMLSHRSGMHLGSFNTELPRHSVNPRIIDIVIGIATIRELTNGCNGIGIGVPPIIFNILVNA